ncbi:hypothetical protein ACDF64_07855 [Agromyces sp. MMS24-JH15]|uniref:hypothetical protein n=1 Tax=Agromyces sp. MMS24-JH15 TaxID=3243765 RepID=UPI00374931A1
MPKRTTPAPTARTSTGVAVILVGITLNLIGFALLDGFANGLVIGFAVVVMLAGIVLLGSALGWGASRNPSSEARGWWLPSRDNDR